MLEVSALLFATTCTLASVYYGLQIYESIVRISDRLALKKHLEGCRGLLTVIHASSLEGVGNPHSQLVKKGDVNP